MPSPSPRPQSRAGVESDRGGAQDLIAAPLAPPAGPPARRLVPLEEIIAEVLGVNANSVKVKREYLRLTNEAREFEILLDLSEEDLVNLAGERTAEAIMKVRRGDISITPGFDGEFGKIRIFGKAPEPTPKGPRQIGLF